MLFQDMEPSCVSASVNPESWNSTPVRSSNAAQDFPTGQINIEEWTGPEACLQDEIFKILQVS